MNQRLYLALVMAWLLAPMPACHKSNSDAAASGADQVATTLAELTQTVRKFAVEQRQVPKTLDELVARGYLETIPAAPQGKKFTIDENLQVHLANR